MKGALSGDLIVTLAPRPAQGTSHLLVPGGAVANYLLTLSDDDLTLVPMGDPSSRVHVANLGSGPIADCSASGEAIVLDRGESARAAFDRMLDEWKTLTSIALVGLAARAHEIAIDHVQFRQIFGLPLGSFQSVAHRLAEAIVQIDGARFLSYEAAWSIDHEIPQVGAFASAAFAYCSETAFKTASIALHLHGGVGYTVEHDIQLFYRRAKAWPLILGDPSREYERVADIIWSRE
jgi:alkylation response protein AidB-like acyl-CoA dehydrogenase